MIKKAEVFLNVSFHQDYIDFLKKWGTISIGAFEIYGVTSDKFEISNGPNAVWYTHETRKKGWLPLEYVVFFDNNGEEVYCLNTNNKKFCEVVVLNTTTKQKRRANPNNFFDFILEKAIVYL